MSRVDNQNLTYRRAEHEDVELYFRWVNDSAVRSAAFSQSKITWEEHCSWFYKKLESRSLLVVFLQSMQPVGQIRVDFLSELEGEIDFSVDAQFRGQAIGSKMLLETTLLARAFNPRLNLTGLVKANNIGSIHSFEGAGFERVDRLEVKGFQCVKFRSTNLEGNQL